MIDFIGLLSNFLSGPLYNELRNYLKIRKGELKDEEFETFYRTLVVAFTGEQKGLDRGQAAKFFASPVTYDGVLA